MFTFVKGIRIELTTDQIKIIDAEQKKRERCRNSFVKMLKRFGFKQVDTTGWANPKQLCFEHKLYNWFAEIYDHGCWNSAWVVGGGLKDGSFPGGWVYDEPEQIEQELSRVIDEIQNNKE